MTNILTRTKITTSTAPIIGAVAVSLILLAEQRVLNPLYGSYLTLYSLDAVVCIALFTSALKPFGVPSWNWLAAGLLLTIAPNASYWVGVWMARERWSVLGPALTHAAVVAPLVFVFTNTMAQYASVNAAFQFRLLRAGLVYFISKLMTQKVWPRVPILYNVSETQIFLTLAVVAFGAFILKLDFSPSRPAKLKKRGKELAPRSPLPSTQIKASLFIALGALWYTSSPRFANPILPHPLRQTFTHPSGKLQIHSAVQSITGLIEVAETFPLLHGKEDPMHSARYLRVDHSLLGGVWMRDKAVALDDELFIKDAFGTKLGDTVYSTFALQEAARLVNSTETGKTGKWRNALTIGLGTGFSTTAFIRHGLNTTVVEIDPAVYDAARIWFGLPDPGVGNVFLEDARQFVERRTREIHAGSATNLYDIVVHDCFSGGGVPEHIFTTEFWNGLKQIMDAEGILVVNFAGVINSDSSKMILHTLEHNFKQCHAFHDWMYTFEEDKYDDEFINVVFFCTNSDAPMTFRKPKWTDCLGSHLRKLIFQSLDTRKINMNLIRENDTEEIKKYILTDAYNPLGDLQRKQHFHHWEVMRKVLQDIHWETY